MTISVLYTAKIYVYTGQTTFYFPWECIGLEALEVWLETGTAERGVYDRELLAPQDYYVTFGGGSPTSIGGTVTVTRSVPGTVDRVSIERNTPISQLTDLKKFSSFKMPTLEKMLDRLIMIVQELLDKKCGVLFTTVPLQPYRFDEYTVLSATVVDAALEAVKDAIDVLQATGTDCTANPGGA